MSDKYYKKYLKYKNKYLLQKGGNPTGVYTNPYSQPIDTFNGGLNMWDIKKYLYNKIKYGWPIYDHEIREGIPKKIIVTRSEYNEVVNDIEFVARVLITLVSQYKQISYTVIKIINSHIYKYLVFLNTMKDSSEPDLLQFKVVDKNCTLQHKKCSDLFNNIIITKHFNQFWYSCINNTVPDGTNINLNIEDIKKFMQEKHALLQKLNDSIITDYQKTLDELRGFLQSCIAKFPVIFMTNNTQPEQKQIFLNELSDYNDTDPVHVERITLLEELEKNYDTILEAAKTQTKHLDLVKKEQNDGDAVDNMED